MGQYRTQTKIVADLLLAAHDMNGEGTGVGVTTLLRSANMPYGRMSKLLSELVGSGLLEEFRGERGAKYVVSQKGLQFLNAYKSFADFAASFGLRL